MRSSAARALASLGLLNTTCTHTHTHTHTQTHTWKLVIRFCSCQLVQEEKGLQTSMHIAVSAEEG